MTYPDVGEKGTKPLGKELAQSGLPVWRKIPKPPENLLFRDGFYFHVKMKNVTHINTVDPVTHGAEGTVTGDIVE